MEQGFAGRYIVRLAGGTGSNPAEVQRESTHGLGDSAHVLAFDDERVDGRTVACKTYKVRLDGQ